MFSVELIMNKGNGNLDHAKQNMELNNNISIETKSSKLLPISIPNTLNLNYLSVNPKQIL